MFTPLTNLEENASNNLGIIKLWSTPNLKDGSWSLTGEFGKDLYAYFYLPRGVIYENGVLKDNFALRYAEIQIYLVKFYGLYYFPKPIFVLETDSNTKLPFVRTVSHGEPEFVSEKLYFIPATGEV